MGDDIFLFYSLGSSIIAKCQDEYTIDKLKGRNQPVFQVSTE